MAYVALFDADVLHPYLSVDLLLRLAERRMFRPAWSEEILAEVRNSLTTGRLCVLAHRLASDRPPRTPSGYEGPLIDAHRQEFGAIPFANSLAPAIDD